MQQEGERMDSFLFAALKAFINYNKKEMAINLHILTASFGFEFIFWSQLKTIPGKEVSPILRFP